MKHEFIYAGVSCRDFGIWSNGHKTAKTPVRDVSKVEVPGRSGDLIIDNGRYKNTTQTYNCFANRDFLKCFQRFRSFVLSKTGYQRLEDSYAPDEYRMAAVVDTFDPEIITRLRDGSFTITFDCKPQRYLKVGENEYTFTSDGFLVNPEFCDALPLIKVSGTGTLSIGDSVITISSNPGTITIDSDIMDVYSGTTNCNSCVAFSNHEFPKLGPGVNGVEIGSGITSLLIVPRWWRL